MTPHIEALAYRIWAYASPREWECSHAEISDWTGISVAMVAHVIRAKGWQGRVPHASNENRSEILQKTYATKHHNGQNIDPNLLAVDQLMR